MLGRDALRGQRAVAVEQLGLGLAQPQGPLHHEELGRAGVVDLGQPPVLDPVEQLAADRVVDRPPVVRVHQRQVPQLGALVHVGHAGSGELQELLPQRVRPARQADPLHEGLDLAARHRVAEHLLGPGRDGLLELLVVVDPRGADLGLLGRLVQVVAQPVGPDRPGAHDRLPRQHVQRRLVDAVPRGPPARQVGELVGQLGQHGQPGPHVLGALGVVRGQRRHGLRQRRVPLCREGVELLDGHAEAVRGAADLVERHEPGVPVERGVLGALGHDHAGGLLDPRRQLAVRLGADLLVQHLRALHARHRGRPRRLALGQVGAVDGEVHHHPGHGGLGGGGLRVAHERPDPAHLGAQDRVGHQRAAGVLDGLEVRVLAQFRGQRGEPLLGPRVDEHPADLAQRVVPGGALDGPAGRQRLADAEDLLGDDPHAGALLEPAEVAAGVGQAVRVVDPQAGHLAGRDPAQHLVVRRVEDLGVLDADRRERGDVEEPPVVQLLVRHPPVHQAVVVGHREPVVVVGHDVAVDDRFALVAQDRYQHRARGPVDVEVLGVAGLLAVLQHIPPPRVGLRDGDRHVVGHDVEHEAEPGGGDLLRQREPALLTTQLGAGAGRVHDVVAVRGTRCGVQDRRRVEGADAEPREVVHHLGGVGEGEARPQLEPVGRRRGERLGHSPPVRCSTTSDRATSVSLPPAGMGSPSSGIWTAPVAVSTTTVHCGP